MDEYVMNDQNTAKEVLATITVPIVWRPLQIDQHRMTGEKELIQYGSCVGCIPPPTHPTDPDGYWNYPYNTNTTGAWTEGGTVSIGRALTIQENISIKVANGAAWVPTSDHSAIWWIYSSTLKSILTQYTVEIDWGKTMEKVNKKYSNYLYQIGGAEITDINGENPANMYEDGYASLEDTKTQYNRFSFSEDDIQNPFSYEDSIAKNEAYFEEGQNNGLNYFTLIDWNNSSLQGASPDSTFNDDVIALNGQEGSVTDFRTIPMYLTVQLIDEYVGSAAPDFEDPEVIEQGDESDESSNSISTSGGSSGSGMNRTETNYGNSVLPFDSVYLPGTAYSNFYSAGGGVVSESGIFPSTDVFFVEKVNLSVEGSSATIVEHVKFDETPSLEISEKVFIYILDSTNPYQPVFAGYVNSYSRELLPEGQRIVYECKDLVFYLDQFVSPNYYIYRPPLYNDEGIVKTYDQVLKEILNLAGIPNAVVSLPTATCPPVNWIYESLESILEWALKMFGKYVYYVDRNGRLRIRAVDSGSVVKSYAVPSEGDVLTDSHVVTRFQPIVDNSRTRSRIILTGDFELREHKVTANYEDTPGYVTHRTQNPLIDRLISNPESGPTAKLYRGFFATTSQYSYQIGEANKDLPITQLATEPGNSFIYIEDVSLNYAGKTQITYQYVTRSLEPIQVIADTGLSGGTEVIKRPEFKKIQGPGVNVDDQAIMNSYLSLIKQFYKPTYGGALSLVGLDTSIQLLDKVSVTGTSLPSSEAASLTVYGIEYNIPEKTTRVELSNKVYYNMPYFDILRERTRRTNETLVKAGQIELGSLYKRL
jgi:hypothetical protein